MPSDPFALIGRIEAKSPRAALFVTMAMLGFISPFNRHLRARLIEWTDRRAVVQVRRRRRVRNHVGGIHAGALFTLGETCAGLVIIRNFPFSAYRPLMSDVRVQYLKQARGDVTGECEMPPGALARLQEELSRDEVPSIDMVTHIRNADGEIIAEATTTWQVKPWRLVRTK